MGLTSYGISTKEKKHALITGASGFIGQQLVKTLIAQQFNLTLFGNKNTSLLNKFNSPDITINIKQVDLLKHNDLLKNLKSVEAQEITHVFHLASSLPVQANFESLYKINIEAYQVLIQYFLPSMLQRGDGHFIAMGSSYAFTPPEDERLLTYAMVKASLMSVSNFWARKCHHLVKFIYLAPGPVDTPLNKSSDLPNLISPRNLVETVLELTPRVKSGAVIQFSQNKENLESTYLQFAQALDFSTKDLSSNQKVLKTNPEARKVANLDELKTDLTKIFKEVFSSLVNFNDQEISKLASEGSSGVGSPFTGLPDWDSLGHLKLVMELESAFQVKVRSNVIKDLKSFQDILIFLEKATIRDNP